MRDEILSAEPVVDEEVDAGDPLSAEGGSAAPVAGRLRRPGRAQEPPAHRARGGPAAQPGGRPPALRRSARPGQDHAGGHRRGRDGRGPARHLGSGARAGRRPGRHPQQARGRRRAVHRRDPPAVPGRRRGALPGDGGLRAGHPGGQGTRRPARSGCRWPRFTLVGATTRTGLITGPLRDRFGLVARLEYYDAADLESIVIRAAGILGVPVDPDGAREIARRARGTPRIANRLLRRVQDYAEVEGRGTVDEATAQEGLAIFGVDDLRSRQGRPGHPRVRSVAASAAARWACRRWPSASANPPRPSRTSTSRS